MMVFPGLLRLIDNGLEGEAINRVTLWLACSSSSRLGKCSAATTFGLGYLAYCVEHRLESRLIRGCDLLRRRAKNIGDWPLVSAWFSLFELQ